ncbi:AEC family transporter [Acinetobacter lanii]|uniref:AEC family transporter n=1 Tax=Acinetobacter lanii TaxID=2715163 RepID=A0A6G8S891_9GAMM|nr:AEC family transporter [Acinetobacter lanii]QIO10322.1 AEC family transporter [Acinetobacter lanii]
MHSILLSLFPLIALILSGYVLKRTAFLNDGFWAGAEKLNYYVLFPAMLFGNLAAADIHFAMVKSIVMMLSIMLLMLMLVLYGLKVILNIRPARFGVMVQSNIRFNTYMGLAIVAALFQQQGMTLFAILLAVSIPVVNVLSVLAFTEKDGMKLNTILLSLLKNPLIMSCIVGIAFNLSELKLWQGAHAYLQQFALCSLPLGLMCVGAALQFLALKKDLMPLVINTFSRLMVIPLIALLIVKWLGFTELQTQVFVLYFALPTASASYILSKVLGGDSQLMAGIISLQTLCAAVTLPIILSFML